jgi:hypothetical protein
VRGLQYGCNVEAREWIGARCNPASWSGTGLVREIADGVSVSYRIKIDQQSNLRVFITTTADLFSCSTFNLIRVPALA